MGRDWQKRGAASGWRAHTWQPHSAETAWAAAELSESCVPWPPEFTHLAVPRGTTFYAHVKDPLYWRRTGLYQFVVAGWDEKSKCYEAWEPSGLHTSLFSEAVVTSGIQLLESTSHRGKEDVRTVAWWSEGDLLGLPALEAFGSSNTSSRNPRSSSSRARPESRDRVFPPTLSGWRPYGTLELAGPLLFQLHAKRRAAPQRFSSICDVGAGTGRASAWLSHAWGFEVTALDVILPESPEFEVKLFDGRQIPLPDKSVDCVLFSFVLHHCRHFELQRALLMEAARVARSWVLICEDTPEVEQHWKNTKGHDRLGQFHSAADWQQEFRRLKLRVLHSGNMWEGRNPSPYPCKRTYFILEVPTWLRPQPAAAGPAGLSSCCALLPRGMHSDKLEPGSDTLEDSGSLEAAMQEDPDGAVLLSDIQATWLCDCTASNPMASFAALRLPKSIAEALHEQGFKTPSPIQKAAIPMALSGKDLVGVAATGSGKTLAYLLPSLLRLLSAKMPAGPFCLVLLPTRELALQVASCGNMLLSAADAHGVNQEVDQGDGNCELLSRISVVAIWGGGPRWEQLGQLRNGNTWCKDGSRGSWFLAATPGRLLDLVCEEEVQGRRPLATVRVLVLDEGDRLLEEGLGDQLDALARRTAVLRQTLFFSATWSEDKVGSLAKRLCRKMPIVLRIGTDCPESEEQSSTKPSLLQTSLAASLNRNIRQSIEVFDDPDESEEERETRKRARLLELLELVCEQPSTACAAEMQGKAIVFCTTKKFADSLVGHLREQGCGAVAVHGNKTQPERLRNLESFASGDSTARVLVATDVLGRGLDIPAVTHVFVYDFPGTIDDYIHRIGRTARGMDTQGEAITFFEFAPCLPGLAQELAEYLEQAAQPVPEALRKIAKEVAEGSRSNRPSKTKQEPKVEAECSATESWAPLALPDELGSWHAAGQRSWMICERASSEGPEAVEVYEQATGWVVFCRDGLLQTHQGDGTWQLLEDEQMHVKFGSIDVLLTLLKTWGGKKRLNFVSGTRREPEQAATHDGSPCETCLAGWVTKSKNYKYSDAG